MNKFILLLIILFAQPIICLSQTNAFAKYYSSSFPSIQLPFSSDDILTKLHVLPGLEGKADFQIFYKTVIEKGEIEKLKLSLYVPLSPNDNVFPLGRVVDLTSTVFLFYMVISPSENDKLSHKIIAKSFTNAGSPIDSIVIDQYFADEGEIRRISFIDKGLNIQMKEFVSLATEEEDNIERKNSFKFIVKKGIFIAADNYPIFDRDYYLSTVSDILTDFKNDCMVAKDSAKGDLDLDGQQDIVYLLQKGPTKVCNGAEYDVMIGVNNSRNIYKLISTQGGINLGSKDFNIENLEINNGIISYSIFKKGSSHKLTFYYLYDKRINNWRLEKVAVKNLKDHSENIKTFDSEPKSQFIFHSAKIAVSIYNSLN